MLSTVQKSIAVTAAVGAAVVGGAMLMTATSASQAVETNTGNPPGNNGTVKIAEDGDWDGIPQNHPHVGCTFTVEWYNFDANVVSNVTFAMQAPTKDVGLSGTDPAAVQLDDDDAGGADPDPDGIQQYTLAFDGAAHPVQGYHVKLTINTPGSIGADVKHKVFWVTGCGDETTSTTETTATSATTETSATSATTETSATSATTETTETTETSTTDETSVLPSEATETTDHATSDTTVEGEQAVPSAVDAGQSGPDGSGDGKAIGALALLVAALGAGIVGGSVAARRRA